MQTIQVRLKSRGYAIQIGAGLLDRAGEMAREAVGERARRAVIVSNATVAGRYGERLARAFRRAGFQTASAMIGDGERFKTLATAQSLYTFLIEQRVERGDLLVALGGGVVGDLTGFVAATYLRGLRYVQVPTTLLAQIDSSVGGKTGVNHPLGKNMVGAFHQPALVVIDPRTLETLPVRELRAGLFEAIKYGVIRDRALFERIRAATDRLLALDEGEVTALVARCCAIKADVVRRDEREGGLRRILNFGHTVGHALEAVTRYRRFLHGEAVGHGMRAAARIAERMELLEAGERRALDEAVLGVGRLPKTNNLALGAIIDAMSHDKKAKGDRVPFILPVRIGRVVIRDDVPLKLLRHALADSLS